MLLLQLLHFSVYSVLHLTVVHVFACVHGKNTRTVFLPYVVMYAIANRWLECLASFPLC